jgi:hypothetical protein
MIKSRDLLPLRNISCRIEEMISRGPLEKQAVLVAKLKK